MANSRLSSRKRGTKDKTPPVKQLLRFLVIALLLSAVAGCGGDEKPADPTSTPPASQPAQSDDAQIVSTAPVPADPPAPTSPPTVASPTPAASSASASETEDTTTTYEVQPGDTLWGIAIAYGASLDALMAANDIDDADTLWAGRELLIPNAARTPEAVAQIPAPAEPTSPPPDLTSDDAPASSGSAPSLTLAALSDQVLLEPMMHDWQKMNNCGPTTVAMALSYYDLLLTQFDTAPELKGGPGDKNVSPPEMAAYIRDQGFGAKVRVNGDLDLLLQLVNNGIPVIVEQWLDRPDDELTGHYRLVRGYDEVADEIIVNDSYSGPRLHFSYNEFERLWRPFNRLYLPVYKLEQEPLVRTILGDNWNDGAMYEGAAARARAEIESRGDGYAWFNLGSSLVALQRYEEAAQAYDQAEEAGLPPRMFWYQFGAFEAYNQTRQFPRVIELSDPLTGLALEELHFQRGVAFEGLGQPEAALAEYRRAAELNPRLQKAADAVARLQNGSAGS